MSRRHAVPRCTHQTWTPEAVQEHIRQLVAQAPPLSPEQRTRLAVLLRRPTDPPAAERQSA